MHRERGGEPRKVFTSEEDETVDTDFCNGKREMVSM